MATSDEAAKKRVADKIKQENDDKEKAKERAKVTKAVQVIGWRRRDKSQ